MPDKFEDRHLANLRRKEREIRKYYEAAIQQIIVGFTQITINGETFRIRDYPFLQNQVDAIVKKLKVEIYAAVVNGITDSWDLSHTKNNILVDKRLAGKKPSAAAKKILYDPNLEGLKAFIRRKDKGLNLSDRVWNSLSTYKTEMETALGVGISEGRSAVELASDLKKYLNEPDKLFRKVEKDDGSMGLSRAAKNFHPGQGVYRSSYQNALRVTASETNMAYRTADHERWLSLPFVTGIQINLSKNHPEYDICDTLAGKYPKDFLFKGWHPRCLCFETPIMMSDEEYDKYEDYILGIGDKDPSLITQKVEEPPKAFTKYLDDNQERIDGWSSKPYWLGDNLKYTEPEPLVSQVIEQAKERLMDTFKFYTPFDGKFTEERQKLHDQIVREILKEGSTNKGTIYTTGGAPANGKSTLLDSGKLPHPKGILNIDPDMIKSMIPEYKKMVKDVDPDAAAFVHEESSYLAKKIVQESIRLNYDFTMDGVGDGSFDSLSKKIKSYKASGKRVRADYVTLDTDLSLKLAKARAEKTGRKVPETYILEMNKAISKLIPELIKNKTLDELYLWDTNENGNPRLILTQIDGKLKIYNQSLYDRFLKKAK